MTTILSFLVANPKLFKAIAWALTVIVAHYVGYFRCAVKMAKAATIEKRIVEPVKPDRVKIIPRIFRGNPTDAEAALLHELENPSVDESGNPRPLTDDEFRLLQRLLKGEPTPAPPLVSEPNREGGLIDAPAEEVARKEQPADAKELMDLLTTPQGAKPLDKTPGAKGCASGVCPQRATNTYQPQGRWFRIFRR